MFIQVFLFINVIVNGRAGGWGFIIIGIGGIWGAIGK